MNLNPTVTAAKITRHFQRPRLKPLMSAGLTSGYL